MTFHVDAAFYYTKGLSPMLLHEAHSKNLATSFGRDSVYLATGLWLQ